MKQPELGRKVLELRLSKGLTQAELAEQCNLSLRTIQRIEALEVTPRNYTVRTILLHLGYHIEEEAQNASSKKISVEDSFRKQFERLYKYVKELFNLRTNTMKKLSVLSLFALIVFGGIFFMNTTLSAQGRKLRSISESMVGVWQKVKVNPETGEVTQYSTYLKIFNSDGTYVHMTQMEGKNAAFINASGKWKLTAENTFVEYVELMYDDLSPNRKEVQNFTLEKRADGLFMSSKYHTAGTKSGDTYETWRKVGLVTRKKAFEMWNTK